MRVIKDKYKESPEFTLFSDFRSAEHKNLFKHRERLEEISKERQPQSKSLKYLQEDC